MSRKSASISKEAQAALDAIAGYEPTLPRNLALPAPGVEGHSRSRGSLREAVPPPETPVFETLPEDIYGPAIRRNVQGNILPGFNKDHQHFLFYRITDVLRTKKFLRVLASSITTMDEVLDFVRAHRALRLDLGVMEPPGLKATWVNIAFSCRGIEKLGAGTGEQFGEQSFRQGMAERSTYLGDPTDPVHPGHRTRWKVGGPHNEADILVIVASDTTTDLEDKVGAVRRSASAERLDLIFEQRGNTLPGNLRGHEHFGFKDGVSQPGIRGRASSAPGTLSRRGTSSLRMTRTNTPRSLAGQDSRSSGQQFLLGEPRQRPNDPLQRGAPQPTSRRGRLRGHTLSAAGSTKTSLPSGTSWQKPQPVWAFPRSGLRRR